MKECNIVVNNCNKFDGKPVKLGIDEAGRGPVLGSMVYACFYCPAETEAKLKELNVDDSKKLTEGKRDEMYEAIESHNHLFGYIVCNLSPRELSAKMLRKKKYNLNEISHDTAISLIKQAVQDGVLVKEVYVDTVGKPDIYQRKLQAIFPSMKITVKEKADSLFPVVSAASICAKVNRDYILKHWLQNNYEDFLIQERGHVHDEITNEVFSHCEGQIIAVDSERKTKTTSKCNGNLGKITKEDNKKSDNSQRVKDGDKEAIDNAEPLLLETGSGYPGDPLTKTFLDSTFDKVFGFPDIVRFSWSTARDRIEKNGVAVDWFESVEDNSMGSNMMMAFTCKKNKALLQRGNNPPIFYSRNIMQTLAII